MFGLVELGAGFLVGTIVLPALFAISKALGLYAVVREREAQVFTLFGRVLGVMDEPGLRFPIRFGIKAVLVPFFGKRRRSTSACASATSGSR